MKANFRSATALVCAAFATLVCAAFAAMTSVAQAGEATPPALLPPYSGSLVPNQHPMSYDLGPLGDTVYVTGVASGIGRVQSHGTTGDKKAVADITNGQVFIQKVDGFFQYYIQVGAYSFPALGAPYGKAGPTTSNSFGPLPQAFLKLAPTDNLSVIAGKLPTLFGGEYAFSFENMNVDRGLLWGQINAVARGVQINYAAGPLAFAVSWNDGMYSNRLSWLTGSATYTIDSANSVAFVGGANLAHTYHSTPLIKNNQQIFNFIYSFKSGPLTVQPYLQYTHVPSDINLGLTEAGSTIGGALLVNYALTPNISLPARFEYITSTGTTAGGAPSLLYGAGSDAWSITFTPTFQYNIFFARPEVSFVKAVSATPGTAFGPLGNDTTQVRGVFEIGILF